MSFFVSKIPTLTLVTEKASRYQNDEFRNIFSNLMNCEVQNINT